MAVKLGRMVLGNIQTNCYFVFDEEKKEALVFDPASDGDLIYEKLKTLDLKIIAILLTHGHYDHILGVEELKKKTGAKLYFSEKEEKVCLNPDLNFINSPSNNTIIYFNSIK